MYILREDHRIRRAAIFGVSAVAVFTLLHILHTLIGQTVILWAISLGNVLSSAVCALLCGILWHHFRAGEVLKRIWGSLWIGLTLWTVGEIIYAIYDVFLVEEAPYPSLADVLFVPGFIPLFLALFFRYNSLRISPPRRLVIVSGAAFGTVTALWLVFVLGPIVESPESGSTIEQILSIVYPLGDLLVVMGALLSMLALAGGELSLPWGSIALGCLVLAFSDSLYSYSNWEGIYQPDSGLNFITALTDISYFAGYVTIALGLYVQTRLQRIL